MNTMGNNVYNKEDIVKISQDIQKVSSFFGTMEKLEEFTKLDFEKQKAIIPNVIVTSNSMFNLVIAGAKINLSDKSGRSSHLPKFIATLTEMTR